MCAAVLASTAFTSTASAVSGAVFTTDENGTLVNGNIYDDCCDVYLNGGPPPNAPCDSAGLPDGEYYFQVTDPSGSVLLSNDDIEQRRFRVENGLIVEYLGTPGTCMHEIGAGKCAALVPANISIQLMPFDPTPNPGGVHKMHVTPVDEYDPDNPQSNFGFVPSQTKTDNFKCEQEADGDECKIIIRKFKDRNANGYNDDEPPLDGVDFNVCYTPPGGSEICTTITSGDFAPGQAKINVPAGSEVLVCEKIPSSDGGCDWKQTTPNESTPGAVLVDGQWCFWFVCSPDSDDVIDLEFGNVCVDYPDEGKPIEYWTEPSGKAVLKGNDPTWREKMNNLALCDTVGGDCDLHSGAFSGACSDFSDWLENANELNIAYSRQWHRHCNWCRQRCSRRLPRNIHPPPHRDGDDRTQQQEQNYPGESSLHVGATRCGLTGLPHSVHVALSPVG